MRHEVADVGHVGGHVVLGARVEVVVVPEDGGLDALVFGPKKENRFVPFRVLFSVYSWICFFGLKT